MNDWLSRYRGYLFLSLIFVTALGGVYFLSHRTDPKPVQINTPFPRPIATLRPNPTPVSLVVQVSGAVVNPGLVHLSEGARVDDAIRAAGGPSEEADLASLNLARKVSDGEMLLVPKIGDSMTTPAAPAAGRSTPGTRVPRATATATAVLMVNINSASAAELNMLPGIGPSHAQAIIDYRQTNGPFQKIEDITKVRGIGPVEFEAIKNLIVVE
jgi:competence protein ComEA